MDQARTAIEVPRHGQPAPLVRAFGWAMLGALAAFILNNIAVVWFGFPGARALATDPRAWIEVAIFAVGILAAMGFVMATGAQSLRWDAFRIDQFNRWLIRGLFWSVFLVGVVDSSIALLRVEELTEPLFGEAIATGLVRASWVGLHVHVPLIVAGFLIGSFTRTLGFPWLALLIVAAELLIVLSRFVFSYEQALMSDLVRYWYAALFLFASAYTLFDEGHVRVDVFYAGFGQTTKGRVNAIGTILLGMTTSWVILAVGFNGRTSIINAPMANWETSTAGVYGMFVKYQMAGFLGLFAITMLIQFVSYFFDAVADAKGEPGHRAPDEITH